MRGTLVAGAVFLAAAVSALAGGSAAVTAEAQVRGQCAVDLNDVVYCQMLGQLTTSRGGTAQARFNVQGRPVGTRNRQWEGDLLLTAGSSRAQLEVTASAPNRTSFSNVRCTWNARSRGGAFSRPATLNGGTCRMTARLPGPQSKEQGTITLRFPVFYELTR